MAFLEYKVYSLKEYIECIEDIGRTQAFDQDTPNVLWSRGHRVANWELRPTLLRDIALNAHDNPRYSCRAMEEEMRKQHYIAKNYHFLGKEPASDLEWMEVMQHHGVKTRILDWSESLMHSLIFALECFFNNKEFRTEERKNATPCVWILEPIKWNMKALETMLPRTELIDSCMESLPDMPTYKSDPIRRRFESMENELHNYLAMKSARHLGALFNLSRIEKQLQSMSSEELLYQLSEGEFYYCLFYFLKHVYLETAPLELDWAMPLSIVESYHSERIRAQKGAFSIFPYYKETQRLKSAHNLKMHPDVMENMDKCNSFLQKILLCDADKIAFEVMNAGMNVSWLYPEMPVVANAIEQRKIYR